MSFQTLQMSLPLSPETPRPQGTRRPSTLSLLSRPPISPSSPHQMPLCPIPSLQTPDSPLFPTPDAPPARPFSPGQADSSPHSLSQL